MIEMRQYVTERPAAGPPDGRYKALVTVLQYRIQLIGRNAWTDWMDVPQVIDPALSKEPA